MKSHNIEDKSRIVMIGDNPETDIEFGHNSGIDTILVTTGVTSKEEAKDIKTTYICDHLYL
jgi:ribonucleotide monophosphatase NagD (HAD superfamily)